ncbi:MAG: hypothetical protein R2861_10810 [Desulfobacterales bacterium]
MSSLAACIHLKLMGVEPVLQMVTRDRNRIAVQSDILGAASFDIFNMLCLSGDHQSFGDSPKGQNVHDLDSMQLVQTVRLMQDEANFTRAVRTSSGRRKCLWVRPPTPLPIPLKSGCRDWQKNRIRRGIYQTQCIYNLDKFEEWMKQVCDRGLLKKPISLPVSPRSNPRAWPNS